MERAERQLSTRLADRLRGDDSDRLARLHQLAGGQIAAVALRAHAALRFARKHGAYFHGFDGCLGNPAAFLSSIISPASTITCRHRINNIMHRNTSEDTFGKRLLHIFAFFQCAGNNTADRSAIFFLDDCVLRNVHKAACQVSGIRCLQSGVGKTLAGAVRRDKVLKDRKPFTEVCDDRVLDQLAGRAGKDFCGFAMSPRIPAS